MAGAAQAWPLPQLGPPAAKPHPLRRTGTRLTLSPASGPAQWGDLHFI